MKIIFLREEKRRYFDNRFSGSEAFLMQNGTPRIIFITNNSFIV